MVRPHDSRLYGEQTFAFVQSNQASVSGLLSRGLGDDPAGQDSPSGDSVPVRVWGRAVGALLGTSDPFHASGGGVEAGGDVGFSPGGRVGAAIGYENVNLSDSEGGSASQDIVRIGLYGSQSTGGVVFSAAISYAHAWDRSDRASGLGPSTASRGADAFTGGVQMAAPITRGALTVTPTVGLLVSNVTGDAFTERNGLLSAFAVHGDSSSVTAISPFAQVSLSHAFTTGGGVVVTPDLLLGYRYDGSADSGHITLVAEDGTVFVGDKVDLDPNTAVVGAGLSAHKDNLTGFISYRATVSSNWDDQSVTAGLRWAF